MFDIGFSELLIVFIVGLLILGPERLPHAAKTAGLWIRKIKRSIGSVQREINEQLDKEELQQKIQETNQRIMAESNAIQNTITPLPETANLDQEPTAPEPTTTENSSASNVEAEVKNDAATPSEASAVEKRVETEKS
ncbi:Sec-independent protein translocase protein TatB [Marinomonas sp. 15G1-11]|uniref:Sec-independent protein translocase protein TatB n=1 Tax=Marinomonas phaeophyticola TaxID=3004091 RepID=A0ABT4JZC3_9GAMM|nr:Sec-independent protein translocase protein TatB [Marinomonas sp. 15G1-11]MCZ2723581.1 Sec-independent protein translocase protein TatB [Marinomonas sp. 15G1-11]